MGITVVNPLSELRQDIATALSEAGIRTVDYAETKLSPPLAVVVPDDNYIVLQTGNNFKFGEYNVAVQVMLLGPPKSSNRVAADSMDELILTAIRALDEDFDIVNVSAPGEAAFSGNTYFGAIIQIEAQLKLGEDE
ncbi:hypothetical protein [Rhodococcus opacus]|uniref:hypothetical protein n=1 Tax=Rhodococcus opacus TaxID=37919 RepID=UPI0011D154DF|nr:hypothetical protein [Rhodococcus opacus]